MRTLLIIGYLICFFASGGVVAEGARNEARIGVLAYRGSDQLQLRWVPLRDYLNAVVPDWSFEIVPMTLSSASDQIGAGQVDFVITNPGHFVALNRQHRLSVLASRSQLKSDGTFAEEFGSAIIALASSDIRGLDDVAGKSVAAIDPNAFGGFQVAWYEFDRAGIDLFSDTTEVQFVGFPMDQVVMQVLEGRADVGIVRSGLMEELVREGRISAGAFRYINGNVTYSHPDKVSTKLYPEWPFAALAATDRTLKDRVALALLQVQTSPVAQSVGMIDVWSAPVPYHSARELADAFAARLDRYGNGGGVSALLLGWMITAFVAVACAGVWLHRRARAAPQNDVPDKAGAAGLTQREREILALVAQGNSTKEIAIDLGISPKTVEFHRSNLLRKFGARTSSQLIALAT